MDTSCLFFLALFSYQLLLLQLHYSVSAADDESKTPWYKPGCQQKVFNCKGFGEFKFPYTNETSPTCAPGRLDCSSAFPKLTLSSSIYEVKRFPTEETVEVIFPPLTTLKSSNSCEIFNYNISFPNSGAVSFTVTPNITLLRCYGNEPPPYLPNLRNHNCGYYKFYYSYKEGFQITDLQTPPPGCDIITLPAAPDVDGPGDLFSHLASEFTIRFNVSTQCQDCISKGNRCSLLQPDFSCRKDEGIGNQPHCPKSFDCGSQKQFTFPYTNTTSPSCGLCMLNCSKSGIKLKLGLVEYDVKKVSGDQRIKVIDKQLQILKSNLSCEIFNSSINLPNTPSIAFTYFPNITPMKCPKPPSPYSQDPYLQPDFMLRNHTCDDFIVYSFNPQVPFPAETPGHPPFCELITLPAVDYKSSGGDVFSDLADEFTIRFDVSNECRNCIKNGQPCPTPESSGSSCVREKVVNTPEKKGVNPRGPNLPLILGTAGGFLIVLCLLLLGVWYRRKWSNVFSYVFARTTSSDPSSTLDPEGGNIYFGVPIFSYAELQEATNNFDPSTELGDGGFGTVYLGKLKDGREVAVKRLYERSYKRVTQFQNEIEILTRLRHKNLVSLYGCTSSQSRELLLVYEYIPNGTVADHLHGDRANNGPLTWPNRIHIALETASALVYLHASEIIHRDVKTNNILLDQNFTVKVADFGLSRLFPTDKTHVSTAPQGTPGYVDPEYHQCYQLTEKSDVYSFGVVLAELISSLPAVDISRHRHEINLANLAINKIQGGELGDFVDPNLGFGSDPLTERMITSVAEVAFRCLQVDKDMRPSMDEVLETLQEIADYKDEKEGENLDKVGSGKAAAWITPSPESEDAILLKNRNVSTPDSMTDKWTSGSTTSTSNA